MERLPEIKAQLASVKDRRLGELAAELDVLEDLRDRIARTICDEPPFSVREGGFIRDGFDQEVDRLRHILPGGQGRHSGDGGPGEGENRHPDAENRL